MKNRTNGALVLVMYLSLLLARSSAGFAPERITGFCHPKQLHSCDGLRRRRPRSDMKPGSNRQCHTSTTTTVHMIRGGAAAVLTISKPLVAKVCAGFLAFNGVSLLFAPILFVEKCYKIDIEKDSLETYLLKAIGAISIGISVNVYLSLIQNMTAQRAMGFALLPRFLYVLKSSLLGKDLEKIGGSKRFLSTNEIIMGWTTFSLLTGAGNPFVSAKVFSSMALLKGAFFVLNPVAASNKFLDIDVSKEGMNKSRALCRAFGNELTTSALLMGTLAFGVDPIKAAGYTCLLWTLLLADMAFRDKTYLLMGESSPQSQIVHLCIAALFAAGFLA